MPSISGTACHKYVFDFVYTLLAAGYLSGFDRIVSLMQQQCHRFGILVEKIGLDGIDPEREHVRSQRN